MRKIGLIWRTVRYLKSRQLIYQLINRLRTRPVLHLPDVAPLGHFLSTPNADKSVSYHNRTFTFLNQSVEFPTTTDWNFSANGKLWTYNLNYFDYLNQPELTVDEGLLLIQAFIAQTNTLKNGLDSYPTSLRIINWTQFISRHRIHNDMINAHLFAQTALLRQRLEYHLAGNHLLENSFALLIGALYFRHKTWFSVASKLMHQELGIQILADGSHDERSPMYHQIILDRLLDVLLALHNDSWHTDRNLVDLLSRKAAQMLNWLNDKTFTNGDIPMVNDAAWGIAPTTAQIRAKAELLSLPTVRKIKSKESGYRMFRFARYELFADVSPIGPDHQPGHAHADTFSFVLYVDNQPVLVDIGTSTYQTGPRRTWERSTAAHNTVEVGGINSSEIWAGFRVGRRAKVNIRTDSDHMLSAQHNGYQHVGVTHERTWQFELTQIEILDKVSVNAGYAHKPSVARFHFHSNESVTLVTNCVTIGSIAVDFSSSVRLTLVLKFYDLAAGFNQLRPGQCLEVTFADYLKTTVTIRE